MRRRISACILFILVDFEALGTISEHAAPLTLTNEVIPQPTHPPFRNPPIRLSPLPKWISQPGCERAFFGESWFIYLFIFGLC